MSSTVFIYFRTIDGNTTLHPSYDCLLRNSIEKCSLNRFSAYNFLPWSVSYPFLNILNISILKKKEEEKKRKISSPYSICVLFLFINSKRCLGNYCKNCNAFPCPHTFSQLLITGGKGVPVPVAASRLSCPMASDRSALVYLFFNLFAL